MTDLVQIDPFLYGYFLDENLEHGERVGLALLHAAKNLKIRFSRQLLPETSFVTESGSSGYSPSDGLWFSHENILKLSDEFPEHEETLNRYLQELNIFKSKSTRLFSEVTEALDHSGAQWGGGWGGHSNPDYGRIINSGTDHIRTIIEENRNNHTDEAWFYNSCSYALDAIDILVKDIVNLLSKWQKNARILMINHSIFVWQRRLKQYPRNLLTISCRLCVHLCLFSPLMVAIHRGALTSICIPHILKPRTRKT